MNAASPATLPADLAAQLAKLRDIHTPEPITWWPLATGWWALAVLVIVCSLVFLVYEVRRRRSLKFRALKELDQLKQRAAPQLTLLELASELCVLIRRVVLNTAEGSRYAGIHGEDWTRYLSAAPGGMPEEIASFIATAPYAVNDAKDGPTDGSAPVADELVNATENWIRRYA